MIGHKYDALSVVTWVEFLPRSKYTSERMMLGQAG